MAIRDWLFGRRGTGQPGAAPAHPTPAALADTGLHAVRARTGADEQPSALPAWALILRSPFTAWDDATSWLGGRPKAPRDFAWPRDNDHGSGTPRHFLAQIDLAALKPEPGTGHRAPGLPAEGALLVFAGDACSCHVLTAAEMARAVQLSAPEDLPPVKAHGFFGEGTEFPYWPVDPVAYLDTDGGRPAMFPNPFTQPRDWIGNWGLAGLEAEIAAQCLERELRHGAEFEAWHARQKASDKPVKETDVIRSKIRHYRLIREQAPALVQALLAWRDLAYSRPAEDPVDRARLDELFAARIALAQAMEPYPPHTILPGNHQEVWMRLRHDYPALDKPGGFSSLPTEFRPFMQALVTDWRGHRLFGLEPPPPYNYVDLRGHDCVITIRADHLLRTLSEHEDALSFWCPRGDLAAGRFSRGQYLRHSQG
jgi:hypothetical protein